MTTEQLQLLVGANPDGDFGAKSLTATKLWMDRLTSVLTQVLVEFPATRPFIELVFPVNQHPSEEPVFDDRTEKNLATLSGKTQEKARQLLVKAADALPEGTKAIVISGTRTYEEQDELYAQGRTKRGKIVTNAKGGYSNHNFGIAFDIGIFVNGEYIGDSLWYDKLGPIGEELGLEWGGRWRFKDSPHWQLKINYSLAQMRERKEKGLPIG